MATLTSLRLAGWKSIREANIEFRPLNVLIGANGAGKSNLVSFFRLLSAMMLGRLQEYVGTNGGAKSFLHYGAKRTPAIDANLRFTTQEGRNGYSMRLAPAAERTLLFAEEKIEFLPAGGDRPFERVLGGGHRESLLLLPQAPDAGSTEESIQGFLSRCRVYHFHDTSLLSPMRTGCMIDANRFLYPDAGNLPAMLYLYRQRYPKAYRRIVAAVKAITPFFDDFVLEPLRLDPRDIALHWRSKDSDYEFGAHQLSDGMLRAIALFTLLMQPEEDRPEMIVLDEPELGLHPAALAVLADLLKSASQHSQLLVATQSAILIDHFEVDDIVTVNLRDGCSTFDRLNPEQLKHWLEEYTVSELWERNVIGGGPYV